MTELKPCPFCGCSTVIAEMCNLDKMFRVFCEECPAGMELSFADAQIGLGEFISFYEMQKIMDEMTDAWNRRVGDGNGKI